MTDDPDKSILVNRAIQGQYNLGSTFKPFVAWSAMHSGVIGPNDYYLDNGSYTLRVDRSQRLREQRRHGASPVQERDQRGTGKPAAVRAGERGDSTRRVQRRVLLPPRREDLPENHHDQSLMKADLRGSSASATKSGIDLPFEFDRADPRRRRSRRSWSRQEGAQPGEVPRLRRRRQRAARHRPGPAGGHAAAAGQRLLDPGERRLPAHPAASSRRSTQGCIPDKASPGSPTLSRAPCCSRSALRSCARSWTCPRTSRPALNGTPARHPRPRHPLPLELPPPDHRRGPLRRVPVAHRRSPARPAPRRVPANNPWNDSSAFTGFSPDADAAVHGQRVPREGRLRRQGRGALVKCMFLALSGSDVVMDPVQISDPLDTTSTAAGQPETALRLDAASAGSAAAQGLTMALGFLHRKPDSGLGNIRSSPEHAGAQHRLGADGRPGARSP